jgi:hypothetical protein
MFKLCEEIFTHAHSIKIHSSYAEVTFLAVNFSPAPSLQHLQDFSLLSFHKEIQKTSVISMLFVQLCPSLEPADLSSQKLDMNADVIGGPLSPYPIPVNVLIP